MTEITRLYAAKINSGSPKAGKVEGRNDTVLWGFYSSIFVTRLSEGHNTPLFEVLIKPFRGHSDDALYWGWWDNDRQEFQLVFYAKMLVEMCFTYGTKVEEDRGKGKLLPVDVEIIRVVPPEEPDEQGKAKKKKRGGPRPERH